MEIAESDLRTVFFWAITHHEVAFPYAVSEQSIGSNFQEQESISVPTSRSRIQEGGFLILDDEPDKLSRHDDKKLPRHAT